MKNRIKSLMGTLMRKKTPIIFGDLSRFTPVSQEFGLDRGSAISRHYIDTFIERNKALIRGDGLEVGETRYLSRHGTHLNSKCILAICEDAVASSNGSDSVLIGDLADIDPSIGNRFDSFVCTQTLNFIYDFKSAIAGSHALLKKNGVFLGTVSGLDQISRYDMDRWGDYWRFTTKSIEMSLGDVFGADVKVESFGNVLAAQLCLQGVAMEDLPDPSIVDKTDPDYQVIIGFIAKKS